MGKRQRKKKKEKRLGGEQRRLLSLSTSLPRFLSPSPRWIFFSIGWARRRARKKNEIAHPSAPHLTASQIASRPLLRLVWQNTSSSGPSGVEGEEAREKRSRYRPLPISAIGFEKKRKIETKQRACLDARRRRRRRKKKKKTKISKTQKKTPMSPPVLVQSVDLDRRE